MLDNIRGVTHIAVTFLMAVVGILMLTGCPDPVGPDPKYSIILLDPREGRAFSINESGHIVGDVYGLNNKEVPFIWRPDQSPKLTELGTLGGGGGVATGINAYSQVCGWAMLETGIRHAFRWTPTSGMEDLGALSWEPELDKSTAYDINDNGRIVGSSTNPVEERAFIWEEGDGMLPVPGANPGSWAMGINGFSNIAGNQSGDPASGKPQEGRVWLGDGITYEVKNTLGGKDVNVKAINDKLMVVGHAEDEMYQITAIRWSKSEGMNKLGNLGYVIWPDGFPRAIIAEAESINFQGDAVGRAVNYRPEYSGVFAAVLWRNGKTYELNKIIPKGSQWVNLNSATDINNKGCIVGFGEIYPNKVHAFLLVPVVLEKLTLSPAIAVGGQLVVVQAILNGAAPMALDIEATLSDVSRAAQLTSEVTTLSEGGRSAEFYIETQPVADEHYVEVQVSFGGATLTANLTITPR